MTARRQPPAFEDEIDQVEEIIAGVFEELDHEEDIDEENFEEEYEELFDRLVAAHERVLALRSAQRNNLMRAHDDFVQRMSEQ